MKKIIFFFLIITITSRSHSQINIEKFFDGKSQKEIIAWQKTAGNKWFNDHIDVMLKPGDKISSIPVGITINDNMGVKVFSEFGNKLVILDFWSTICTTCIEAFPKMEELQKKFGDQIQIILVNYEETKEYIVDRFRKKNIKMPDLSIITGPREDLKRLFPLVGVPHHSWIKNGEIISRGPSVNTSEEEIKTFLEGKDVSFIYDNNTAPVYEPQYATYSKLLNRKVHPKKYNTLFTSFNNYLSPSDGYYFEEDTTSTEGLVRNTYINRQIIDLYFAAVSQYIGSQLKSDYLVFSPTTVKGTSYYNKLAFVHLNVTDTLRVTSDFVKYGRLTDDMVRNRICYEQFGPKNLSKSRRNESMLNDLNEYFGKEYGLNGFAKKEKVECYILVRTSKEDKLSTNKLTISKNIRDSSGIKTYRVGNSLGMIMRNYIERSPLADIFWQKKEESPFYFINETGFEGGHRVEIILPDPKDIQTIEDLRKNLEQYGLDVVVAERELWFLDIRKKTTQKSEL